MDNVHTDLHECLGHASGQLLPGVDPDALKAYGSTLEEARADIFALYYMADPKLVELGVMPNADAYKAGYYQQMMNGLMTQLVRIKPGDNLEEAHMRNRALIAYWTLALAKEDADKDGSEPALCFAKRDGKTYVKINDYDKLRTYFAKILGELQRIKSEGDFEAGRMLVETYGVKVDPELHKEVLERYQSLHIAPVRWSPSILIPTVVIALHAAMDATMPVRIMRHLECSATVLCANILPFLGRRLSL